MSSTRRHFRTEAKVKYRGYDGNTEVEYMGYSHFLVEDEQRFTYLGIKDHNSHMPSVDMYRRMLTKWKALGQPHSMSAQQLMDVLAAQRYPGA